MDEKLFTNSLRTFTLVICLILPGFVPNVSAAGSDGDAAHAKTAPTPAAAAPAEHVKSAASQEIGTRRKLLVKEAILAKDEILHAMMSIQKKDTKGAFKMLEKADGQLNVLLARDPRLKMAAIDVRASVIDLEDSSGQVQNALKDAKAALDKGDLQTARAFLSPLVSEMRIDTDYLPLEIYPAAIKQASKEIQESKLKMAEATLANALGSVVTDEEIIPLPPIKAESDVLEAERLVNKDKVKNKNQVLALLKSADDHLANANLLGYGKYQDIRDEIASIKAKVEGDMTKPDLFERVKNFFHKLIHGKL